MDDRTFILKENSEEIRNLLTSIGIYVCHCASFVDSDWLIYSTSIANGVHGFGYPYEGETKESTKAMFLHEVKNPVWCENVDEFIEKIMEHEAERGNVGKS